MEEVIWVMNMTIIASLGAFLVGAGTQASKYVRQNTEYSGNTIHITGVIGGIAFIWIASVTMDTVLQKPDTLTFVFLVGILLDIFIVFMAVNAGIEYVKISVSDDRSAASEFHAKKSAVIEISGVYMERGKDKLMKSLGELRMLYHQIL